jgi:hypothetical protein
VVSTTNPHSVWWKLPLQNIEINIYCTLPVVALSKVAIPWHDINPEGPGWSTGDVVLASSRLLLSESSYNVRNIPYTALICLSVVLFAKCTCTFVGKVRSMSKAKDYRPNHAMSDCLSQY